MARNAVWQGNKGVSTRRQVIERIVRYSPIMLAVAIMVPRLLSAQFGFFDDAQTLVHARAMVEGSWSPADELSSFGQFRPVHWLLNAGLYALAGRNPTWYFLSNAVMLALTVAAIIALARALGLGLLGSWFSGVSFCLATATLESAYTLSKPELLQLLLMLLGLWCGVLACGRTDRGSRQRLSAMSLLGFLGACLSKETAMVVVAIAAGWVLVGLLGLRIAHVKASETVRHRLRMFFAAGAAAGLAIALRIVMASGQPTTFNYPSLYEFTLNRLWSNARTWADLLARDYGYLLPLGIVPAVQVLASRRWIRMMNPVDMGVWIAAWLAVYLPWYWTHTYYMLPVCLGFSMAGGLLVRWNVDALASGWHRAGVAALVGLSALGFATVVPNYVTNARLQLSVDSANTELLRYVESEVPAGEAVMLAIPEGSEYARMFEIYVRDLGVRQDMQLLGFDPDRPMPEGAHEFLALSPFVENQFYPSVRLGVFELPSRAYRSALLDASEGEAQLVHEIRRSFTLCNIDPLRVFCPLARTLAYCDAPNTPLDHRVFQYGWSIYSVTR